MTTEPASTPAADDDLLASLTAAVERVDGVPPRLLDGAKAALGWRSLDLDLALLLFDSRTATGPGVRSAGTAIQLSFGTDDASIEVEVTDDGIVGQVVPAAAWVRLQICTDDGVEVGTTCDAAGLFRFDRPPRGPIRLVAGAADGTRATATEWFPI